jgi:hypothetical protein
MAKKQVNDSFIKSSDNKIKASWTVIKEEIRVKHDLPVNTLSEIEKDNLKITNPTEISNELNNFFIDSVQNLITNSFPIGEKKIRVIPSSSTKETKLQFKPVEYKEILKLIKKLPNKNAAGPDEIPYHVLKYCAEDICVPLAHLINESMIQCVFPQRLKLSKVIPLHKKGKLNKLENKRPISLSSFFSKIYEAVLSTQMNDFKINNNVASDSQHASRH